jgi:hypothetical protein
MPDPCVDLLPRRGSRRQIDRQLSISSLCKLLDVGLFILLCPAEFLQSMF